MGDKIKAVLFDMDGVLFDSEPVILEAAMAGLAEYGVRALPDDFIPFIGAGEDRFISGVAEKYGLVYQPGMKTRVYQIYQQILQDYSIRTLQSKKKLTQAVPIKDPNTGRIRTVSFEVEGPIAYIETTTRPRINQENATRCFELYLDESKEQTHRIQEAQKESKTLSGLRKKEERERIIRKHQNMQRLLREVRVVTPFAHLLNFPTQWLRTRRDNLRFLNLIEAVTFLHQYQRQIRQTEDGSEYIESTIDDYKTAYLLAREVLGESFTELKKPQRELLQQIEKLASEKEEELTRRQIREYTGLPDYRLRDLLAELVSLEYLQVIEGRQGKSYHYQLAERAIISGKIVEGLTHPDELIRKIGKMAVVC